MEEKYNEATLNRPFGERSIDATSVRIDTSYYINMIKHEQPWHKNDRNAVTVFKTDTMCIVLVAMHKGAEIVYHVAECVTSVQVLEGSISYHVGNTELDLVRGEIIAVHDGFNYSLMAKEEAVILLTMCYIKQKVL